MIAVLIIFVLAMATSKLVRDMIVGYEFSIRNHAINWKVGGQDGYGFRGYTTVFTCYYITYDFHVVCTWPHSLEYK